MIYWYPKIVFLVSFPRVLPLLPKITISFIVYIDLCINCIDIRVELRSVATEIYCKPNWYFFKTSLSESFSVFSILIHLGISIWINGQLGNVSQCFLIILWLTSNTYSFHTKLSVIILINGILNVVITFDVI